MKTLFLANFKRGSAELASFECHKETDKNYMVVTNSKKELFGEFIWITSRVSKDANVFENKSDAIAYLIEHTEIYKVQLQNSIQEAQKEIEQLKQL